MSAMLNAARRTTVRANAIVRLCAAREQLWRAEGRRAGPRGAAGEPTVLRSVGELRAELLAREEWLHWIDRGTTIRPEADGDWAPVPVAEVADTVRSGAPSDGRRARRERAALKDATPADDRPRRLHSVP